MADSPYDAGPRPMDDVLRFITCGSVDDGKSTLIGRLLFECGALRDDQVLALDRDSARFGTQNGEPDYALLVDGLDDEREQGITIDVAYRHFASRKRRFIVADCPGHVQYTRNMATGASNADVAVVLVDARRGLLSQTRRHTWIVSLFGIRQVVLVVNKMDLVDYDQARFEEIATAYRALAHELGIDEIQPIPVSALRGDNLVERSAQMPWYLGHTLLARLETSIRRQDARQSAVLPVQWINRPHQDFRGYAGTVLHGQLTAGQAVTVLPSGIQSHVARIVGTQGARTCAARGEAVTVLLEDHIDVSRGDVIVADPQGVAVANQLCANLLWLGTQPLVPGRQYLVKLGTKTVVGSVTDIRHRIDVDTQAKLAARELQLNEVALCNLSLSEPVTFLPYAESRDLGGLILIDRESQETVGAATVLHTLRRSSNVTWQDTRVSRTLRARQLRQRARCVWLTGLSGAGKTTIANLVEARLAELGRHGFILDGDNLRHGLNRDLGFSEADRVENMRRVAEVARLMTDAGLIVLVSLISPYAAERRAAKERFEPDEFVEVFVDAPLSVLEARDTKGLYAKARAGVLPNFTGIDALYEAPDSPDLHIDSTAVSPDVAAEQIVRLLLEDEQVDV